MPPAFSHAVQDQQITYQHTIANQPDCRTVVIIQFPESHLKEAQLALDADPSKKILLSAQGYSLPEQTEMRATYKVDLKTLAPNAPETLQSGELGKPRASVEMMYSLITQKRLNEVSEKTTSPWPSQAIEKSIASCESAKKSKQHCECEVRFYAQHLSPRAFDYLQYSQSNPYAFATLKNAFVTDLVKKAGLSCQ